METKHVITIKKKVHIKVEIFTKDEFIRPDGFCCITFYNQGETNAVILDDLTIEPGESHSFNFEADEYIATNIPIRFEESEGDNKLTVTKIYKS